MIRDEFEVLYVLNAASNIMKPQPSLCYSVAIETCSMEQIASLYTAVLHSVSFLVTILLCLGRNKQLLALLRPANLTTANHSHSLAQLTGKVVDHTYIFFRIQITISFIKNQCVELYYGCY